MGDRCHNPCSPNLELDSFYYSRHLLGWEFVGNTKSGRPRSVSNERLYRHRINLDHDSVYTIRQIMAFGLPLFVKGLNLSD